MKKKSKCETKTNVKKTIQYAILSCVSLQISCSSSDSSVENGPIIKSIFPESGSVAGGEKIIINGENFTEDTIVSIGNKNCAETLFVNSQTLQCTTLASDPINQKRDVFVKSSDSAISNLVHGFEYQCPWLFESEQSCGSIPPAKSITQDIEFTMSLFQEGHEFDTNNTGQHNFSDTEDFMFGLQSVNVTTNGLGDVYKILKKIDVGNYDFSNKLPQITVKVTNVVQLKGAQLYLGDTNLSNFYKFNFNSSQGQQWMTEGDWVTFTIPWSGNHVSITGTPNRDNITDVQFRIIDKGQIPVTLNINRLAAVNEQEIYPNGVLSFTFDDGYASQFTIAKPILDEKGFTGMAYVIAEKIGVSNEYMEINQLRKLDDDGWVIAAHSYGAQNHSDRFTNLSYEELERDIIRMRQWLIDNNFSGYNHCAYPKGSFKSDDSTITLELVRKYFTSCRTIHELHRETYPPSDTHKLRVLYVTNGDTLESVKAAIDTAVINKEWIILAFHRFTIDPTIRTEWAADDFKELVNYISEKNIHVATVKDVFDNN